MRPRCSRRRRPSARKKKSNLPRSAVCARWTNDEKSVWLPDVRVAPHGRVVHAREVRGEVDLLHDAYRFAGRGKPEAVAQRDARRLRAQERHDLGREPRERRGRVGLDEEAVGGGRGELVGEGGRVAPLGRALHEHRGRVCERSVLLGLVDEHDVGAASRERSRWLVAHVDEDQRLALRRPRGDRRAPHAEERPFEVDVVHLVTVEVAAGRLVADDGVVLPAVPQPASRPRSRRRPPRTARRAAADACGRSGRRPRSLVETATRHPARPSDTKSSVATFFDTWNGSVCVVVIVATRPIDVVAGAMRAIASSASGRSGAGSKPSSRLTKSRPARSATCASSTRRSGSNSAMPALSSAMPRWSGRAVTLRV